MAYTSCKTHLKTCSVLLLLAIILYSAPSAWCQSSLLQHPRFWEIGPGGGGAEISAAIHPQNKDILFLGQDVGGILKTTDGGETWRHVNVGLALPKGSADSLGVQDISFSPANPDVMFASTWGGLFRSDDAGETWARVIPPGDDWADPDESLFSCAAVDPGGQVVLTGTGDPSEQDAGHGIYRSTDAGLTFKKIANSGIPTAAIIGRLLIDPDTPPQARHIYAATSRGLFRSTNGGLTFTKINGGFPHDNVRDIALSRGGPRKRFWLAMEMTGGGGVFYSADGLTWTNATGNLPLRREGLPQQINVLLADPANPNVAYAPMADSDYSSGGVFRTINSGQTWSAITTNPWDEPNPNGVDLGWATPWGIFPEAAAISALGPPRLLVATAGEPIISDDRGDTWQQVGTRDNGDGTWTGRGVEVTYVYKIAVAENRPGRMYAAYEDIGLWRTDDSGASWSHNFWEIKIGRKESDGCSEVYVNPVDSDEVYAVAATWSNGLREDDAGSWLFHSTDAGANWTNLTTSFRSARGRGCAAIDFSQPESSRTILFAQHGGKLRRSTDGGGTWSVSSSGISSADRKAIFVIVFDPDRPGRVFAGTHNGYGETGTGGGLYRSDDAGVSWERVTSFPHHDIETICFTGSPRRMFTGASSYDRANDIVRGDLLVSDDGGDSFRSVLHAPYVTAIVSLPGKESTLFAGSGGHYFPAENQSAGIYKSTDNGETWQRLPWRLPHTGILSIALPSWNPNQIFIGTRGDGVTTALITSGPGNNQPPVANAGPDQTVTLPQGAATMDVTLDGGSSHDPDGAIASYNWTGSPDPADVAKPTVNLAAGEYTFTLVVTDDDGAQSGPDAVTITVNPAQVNNHPPVADAGPDQTVTLSQGATTMDVQLDGGSSHDPDGAIVSYNWSGSPDPADVAQPTVNLAAGEHTFTLVVTDNDGAQSSPDAVTIMVQAPTGNPVRVWHVETRWPAKGAWVLKEFADSSVTGYGVDLSRGFYRFTGNLDFQNETTAGSFNLIEEGSGTLLEQFTLEDSWYRRDRKTGEPNRIYLYGYSNVSQEELEGRAIAVGSLDAFTGEFNSNRNMIVVNRVRRRLATVRFAADPTMAGLSRINGDEVGGLVLRGFRRKGYGVVQFDGDTFSMSFRLRPGSRPTAVGVTSRWAAPRAKIKLKGG